jgi:hypothetical protein
MRSGLLRDDRVVAELLEIVEVIGLAQLRRGARLGPRRKARARGGHLATYT